MHQYIYIKIYILRAFQILKYLAALIFIRVHSPLFLCHFSTATFSLWVSRSWSLCHFSTATFSRWVSRSWSLCHFSTATFSHRVSRSWSHGTRNYERDDDWMRQLIIYCFRCIVDFVVLLIFFIYIFCVDRSGSLSSSAFNQLKLVTLRIVLTILYLLKTVLQRSLLQCLNSLYKSYKVF